MKKSQPLQKIGEMNNISEKELNKIMSERITLEKCPKCKIGGGNIIVRMQWYGKNGSLHHVSLLRA